MRHLLVRAAVAALTIFPACQRATPQDPAALQLRIYEVPPETARPLMTTLHNVLYDQGKLVGHAYETPDGRLAVTAPASLQAGVQQLVDAVVQRPPTLNRLIDLHYWIVSGRPAATPTPTPPELAEIQPALAEIVRSQGPQAFVVAQRARISSINDERGQIEADQLNVHQTAVQSSDGVVADVEIRYGKSDHVESRVRLAADQIVVLGAAGQPSASPGDATLYYIVRLAPRPDGHHP